MLIRNLSQVEKTAHFVEWGAGTSHRMLTHRDEMGFGICHTIVRAGTESLLEYRNHLEACYCIAGEGEIEDMDGNIYPIYPGVMYALDKYDRHCLRGGKDQDLVLVSVFNPPLLGTERHNLNDQSASSY